MCTGSDAQCLGLPVDSRFEESDVLFICPPCHQVSDRKAGRPSPYYVRPMPRTRPNMIFDVRSDQGFYRDVREKALAGPAPPVANPSDEIRTMEPVYESPAEIRGSTQLIPRSKFLSNGIAILNLRLDAFYVNTGDLGKILEPFATSFFPEGGEVSLIYQDIVFNLSDRRREHEERMRSVVGQLSAAG
jgi:hypothetical protein